MTPETRARKAVRLSMAIGLHPCAELCSHKAGLCDLDKLKMELDFLRLNDREKEFTLAKVMTKLQVKWRSPGIRREEEAADDSGG